MMFMKIVFALSFEKSLRKVALQSTPLYKAYSFFRRDLWWFFGNIWRFSGALWRYRTWDFAHIYGFLAVVLRDVLRSIEAGDEVDEDRLPRMEKLALVRFALRRLDKNEYLDLIEAIGIDEFPEKDAFDLSDSLVRKDWDFVWNTIRDEANGWWS